MTGLSLLLVVFFLAIATPNIHGYGYAEIHAKDTFMNPNLEYLFGTDHFGRDVLTRVNFGLRVSLIIGILAVLISVIIGVPTGLLSGYYSGKTDEVIMRITDIMLAFPPILLALLIITILGPSLGSLILAIGISYIPQFIRIVRGSVLSIREKEYVEAAKSLGFSNLNIMSKQILPNVLSPIVVQATINVSFAILYEAVLSFVGLGIQPPNPTLGGMISDGRPYLEISPWMSIFPGIVLSILILGVNLLGDGLRDALDPRLMLR